MRQQLVTFFNTHPLLEKACLLPVSSSLILYSLACFFSTVFYQERQPKFIRNLDLNIYNSVSRPKMSRRQTHNDTHRARHSARLHKPSLARQECHQGMDSEFDANFVNESVNVGEDNRDRCGIGIDDYGMHPGRHSIQGRSSGQQGPRSRHVTGQMDDTHLHPQESQAGGRGVPQHDRHVRFETQMDTRPRVVDMRLNPHQRHGEGRGPPHTQSILTVGSSQSSRSLSSLQKERRVLETRLRDLVESRMDTKSVESRINALTREIGRHQEANEEFNDTPDIFDYDIEESGFPPHGSPYRHYQPPSGYDPYFGR